MLGGALFRANAKRIPLSLAHPIAMLGTLAVTLGGYFAGADHPEALFGYGVVCIASFAVFELAGAIVQTAFIGLCYAVLLFVQPGNYGPVSRGRSSSPVSRSRRWSCSGW